MKAFYAFCTLYNPSWRALYSRPFPQTPMLMIKSREMGNKYKTEIALFFAPSFVVVREKSGWLEMWSIWCRRVGAFFNRGFFSLS